MYTKSINMKELGIAITLVSFILLSGCKDKTEPERQVVAVEKVGVDNVEIYWQKIKPKRQKPSVTWNACAPFTSKRLPASLTLTTPWRPTKVPKRTSP